MKLSKFLLLICFITFFALLYVYQQNQIYHLAYSNEKKQAVLSNLLDKNNIFRYNINKFSSLTCLEGKILRNADFELPQARQLVRFESGVENIKIDLESKRRTNLLTTFFSNSRQAEAQTIKR